MSVAAPEANLLRQRLAALRRRHLFVVVARGLACVLGFALFLGTAAALLDSLTHRLALERALALVGLLVGAGALGYFLLYRPLATRIDDLTLALRVERRYPALNDALASTVQFLEQGEAAGDSPSLRREAVRRALAHAEGVDFRAVVDAGGLRLAGAYLLATAALAGALAFSHPSRARTAVVRLLDPFGVHPWTVLGLAPPERVGLEQPFEFEGTVAGVVPKEVKVEFTAGLSQSRSVPVERESGRAGRFKFELPAGDVQRSFRFRVLANDAVSREFRVEVLPPPALVAFGDKPSPQVRLHPPRYTGLPAAVDLPPGTGNVDAIVGTTATLRAQANRPLRRAWVEHEVGGKQGAFLAPLAGRDALGVLSGVALGRAVWEPVQAALADGRERLEVAFAPLGGGYTLYFEDDTGLRAKRQFTVALRPDPEPRVHLDRPSPSRDVLSVVPTAVLPLEVVAEDAEFGLRSVFLEYQKQGEAGAPRVLTLYHHALGLGREVGPLGGPFLLGARGPRQPLKRLQFGRDFPLTALRGADGLPPRVGDTILLQAAADDFDDVALDKEPGRSHQVALLVVSREAFERKLADDQAEVQKRLTELLAEQRKATAGVAAAQKKLRAGEPLGADELEQLRSAEQLQQQVRERVGDPKEGLRAEVARLREAMRRNGLEFSASDSRLRAVERELERLARAELTELGPRLSAARAGGERRAELRQQRADAEAARARAEAKGQRDQAREEARKQAAARAELERLTEGDVDRVVERELEQARRDGRLREERLQALEKALKKARDLDAQARAAEDKAARARRLADEAEGKAKAEKLTEAKKEAARADGLRREGAKAWEELERAAPPEMKGAVGRARGLDARLKQAQALARAAEDAEAKGGREQAEALRAKEAAARQALDSDLQRGAVTEARAMQEEVEKTLSALLKDELGPWSSTRDIKGEAGRLLDEQRKLEAELDELAKKDFTGKGPEELTEPQKAELEAARDTQRRLHERAAQLLARMKAVAKEREKAKDAETARDLSGAAAAAEKADLAGAMKAAAEQIGQNNLNAAQKNQRRAVEALRELTKDLEDRREAELERLGKKLREAQEKLTELAQEQERLKKKVQEANKLTDKGQREAELKKLARRQQELKKQADDVLAQLSRLRGERARQALGQAGEEMGDAARALARGDGDEDKIDDVLDRLDEARAEVERARRQAEEELGREQLARVADALKGLRERQQGLNAEAARIQGLAQERGEWTRALKASLLRLEENQRGLGQETAGAARKDLKATPVFARLLEKAAQAMGQAGGRFGTMVKEPPEVEALPDKEAARLQAEALRRLDQLLEAIKDAQQSPAPLSQGGGGGPPPGEGGGGSGGAPGDDSVPPVAQLRLLRLMQKELNDRTEAFTKGNPDPEKYGPKEKAELKVIRREQKEIADLLEALRNRGEPDAPAEPGEGEGDGR